MPLSDINRSRLSLILSMLIWGTIGVFRRYIPLSSSLIALIRGAGGTAFLLLFMLLRGKRPSLSAIRRNAVPLLLSGAFIGFNWILLFEAYRFTTVATATLCYYMAPVIVLLLSPLLLHERLTAKRLLCILIALTGMALVSGVAESGAGGSSDLKGILLGLAAAVLYAGVILTNKKMSSISSMDRTVVQLVVSFLMLLPYTLLTGGMEGAVFTPVSLVMLLIVAVVHTGVSYALYFGSMNSLSAQTVAICSYIDPVVAILISALLLSEPMTPLSAAGAVLVLGATLMSELTGSKDK